jgi:4-amino-4-deoxy-L-arabinose transferase-like glycosyltransferase
MLPVEEIHRWAATVPPYQATAGTILVVAAAVLLEGAIRVRGRFLRTLPALGFLVCGAAAFWPLTDERYRVPVRNGLIAAAAVALVAHLLVARPEPEEERAGGRAARGWVLAGWVLAALLLTHQLHRTALMVWEATVVQGLHSAVLGGQDLLRFARERFFWDDGILSAGHTSLFYGAPTYALFEWLGFSPLALRLAPVAATLASIPLVYGIGRRFFGSTAGAAAAVLFALNPSILLYGRYGSSPAGTWLAVLLALFAVWTFLARPRTGWWMGAVCGATLFLATLQYSPGRIVVLILLGFLLLRSLWDWRHLWWQRLVGLILIGAAAAGAWQLQLTAHRQHLFLHARGEQFFQFLRQPGAIESLFGRKLVSQNLRPEQLTWCNKLEILQAVLETTVPQYGRLMAPRPTVPAQGAVMLYDPPSLPLYYAPLVLPILLGIVRSLRHWRSWPHQCLLAWLAAATVPLLLTNRVDSHRIVLFTIPLSFWAGMGVDEAARALRRAGIPRLGQGVVAAALLATIAFAMAHLLFYSRIGASVGVEELLAETRAVPGPVSLAWDTDHRTVAQVQLAMLERMRTERGWTGSMLAEGLVVGIKTPEANRVSEYALREITRLLREGKITLLLAPAERFRGAAAALQRRELRVAERGSLVFRFLRVDAGESATGVAERDMPVLPEIVLTPTPTPLPLATGPQQSLTTLDPLEVRYGFEAPKTNLTWGGGPLSLGGVMYERGFGTHAWTRMKFAVPPDATEFQAIVGLQDGACEKGGVTFEVRGPDDRLLYDSGLMEIISPPRPVRVKVRGLATITLVVTEADNGRDCDHANWVAPVFLLAGP